MLRLVLPPHFARIASTDAIVLTLDLDLSAAPTAALLPGLVVLQRFGAKPGTGQPLKLTRQQLAELIAALAGQPVFFAHHRPETPLSWAGRNLIDVSIHLDSLPEERPKARGSIPRAGQPRLRMVAAPSAEPPRDLSVMTIDGSEHYLAVTLPSRESELHAAALEFLKAHRFVLDPLTRKWWLRDRHKVLNLIATQRTEWTERFGAEFTPNFEKNTAHLHTAEITAAVDEEKDGYGVSLGLKAGAATEAQIREAVASGRNYIEDGQAVFLIDQERLARLESAHRALAGEPAGGAVVRRHRIAKARAAEVSDLLESLAPHYQAPETWRTRSAALHHLSALPPAPAPAALDAQLRPYQRLGTAWLWHLYLQGLGGILADEMGLGKTLQALALLAAARNSTTVLGAPSLVVCPASLVENWRREAARFAPELRVFVHHGSRRLGAGDFALHDLVLTSYGTLARDAELFAAIEFNLILADEAQHLKNRRTQAAQSLRMLRGRGRFLLTGTPLENSLDDLRSLFEFLMPGFLPRPAAGLAREDKVFHDDRLRIQTAPYILRRTKATVARELPEKIEQVIYCEPTSAQQAAYRRIQEDTERELIDLAARGRSEGQLRFAALTQLLRLRQICCDPRLVPGVTAREGDSAKLEAFRELLAESIDEGHRMLVFSQFTALLGLLREELEAQQVPFCYLDGSMTPKARQAQVDRFQQDGTIPVFLISLKAGGTGLNLTGADVVVHYDPWWNPAAEAQATDRAHRIGQTKVVTSYRLICSGTVEEKVVALQETKRQLLAGVFEASDEAAAKLSLADLRELLH